jgi:S1-C subfamily serine protease
MRRVLCVVSLAAAVFGLTSFAPVAAQDQPHGYLGVTVGPGGDGEKGVVVKEAAPDGPAAKAGVKAGDRVVKVAGQEVKDADAFVKAVAAHKPGEKLALTVVRDGKEQTVSAILGERPAPPARRPDLLVPPGDRPPVYLGVQLQPLTPDLRKQLKADVDDGVVVAEVIPNSPAEKAGVKRDDVITAVGGHPVKGPEDVREEVQRAGPGKELALAVVRGGEKLTLKATPRAGVFGSFIIPGDERFPFPDLGSMSDQGRRIRDLERRVEELEKRMRNLEGKAGKSK